MNKALDNQLLKAVHEADLTTFKRLLTGGTVDKGTLNRALVAASYGRNVTVVDLLLRQGANPNQTALLGTVLKTAATNGALPIVKRLIAAGANPHRQTGHESALSAAMSENQIGVMKYLESLKAQIDPSTALRYAAGHGDLGRAETTLAKGADINATRGSDTPLTAAVGAGRLRMVNFLLKHGANPNKQANGCPPLYTAIAVNKNLALVEALLAAGASPDSACYGETILMSAAEQGDLAMVKRLLKWGANLRARDATRNKTVLDYARTGGNKEVLAFLSGYGLVAEREESENLARALKRVFGGTALEHATGMILNAKFIGHKCQFRLEPKRHAVAVRALRYHDAEFSATKLPDIAIGLSKPAIPVSHRPTTLSPAASKQLGLKVYSSLRAGDRAQASLTRFCRRLTPAIRQLALGEGETLVFSSGFAGFAWQGGDIELSLKRLECFAALLTSLVRPIQPQRRLFDREWLIKPMAKSATVKTAHAFGGAIEPPIACPHCQSASNPIIRVDLKDPALPRTVLKNSSLPVTWCLECGEWDATTYPLDGGKPPKNPAPGEDNLPECRMTLVPVPPGKKAGRKSKLGGSPSWVQSDDTPDCPSCSKPMAFVLQMASDSRIAYADMGLLYAFVCPECRILASLVQSH